MISFEEARESFIRDSYTFKDEKEAIISLLNESIELLKNGRTDIALILLDMIKNGGYKLK
ncbi:MAG: hypothetical protein MR902_02085 [Campylobacter sp.]|nr:hypothetical protein [Campylobacter sp.]